MEAWQERMQAVRTRADEVAREVKYQNKLALDVVWGDALDLINESLSIAHAAWLSNRVPVRLPAARSSAANGLELRRNMVILKTTLEKTRVLAGALTTTLAGS